MEIIITVGLPASGKTTYSQQYIDRGYVHLNRDKIGGKVQDLIPLLISAIADGKSVILDNTAVTKESRAQFITKAKELNVPIHCKWIATSADQAQVNASKRILTRYNRNMCGKEFEACKDPNTFGPFVIGSFSKRLEAPSLNEGFTTLEEIPFVRKYDETYVNKALILDYDGTLRVTKSGTHYPMNTDDIQILPNRIEVLNRYRDQGYLLLGVSNQSGIALGRVSAGQVKACFDRTNQLLGQAIDYRFCPHGHFPISCYCRKPNPYFGVEFIEKYKLNPSESFFVGDMGTDKGFSKKCGFKYIDQAEFFK